MRVLAAVLGAGLLGVGVFACCAFVLLWYAVGLFDYYGDVAWNSIPLHYYWGPVLAAAMAAWGSFLVVLAFRGDGGRAQGPPLQPGRARRAARGVVMLLLLLQIGVLAVQGWELWRYDEAVAPYMPTMASEGDAAVRAAFYRWTAVVPFFVQLMSVAAVWVLVLYGMRDSLRGGLAAAGAVWMGAVSWFGAMMAVGFGIGTFD